MSRIAGRACLNASSRRGALPRGASLLARGRAQA